MTNPTHKYSEDQFRLKVTTANPQITLIMEEYTGVDTIYEYQCNHGIFENRGWALIKPRKHCCHKGYHEARTPKNKKTWEQRLDEIRHTWGDRYILDNARPDPVTPGKIIAECRIHGEFSQWAASLLRPGRKEACSICNLESRYADNVAKLKIAAPLAWASRNTTGRFVSKAETRWLDSIGVDIERQYWLADIKYKVDGYDPVTNTVYLFHGKFWHGCPETYDPEEQHPLLKVKMKDLYEKTIMYEDKIKEAGYNLVTIWG